MSAGNEDTKRHSTAFYRLVAISYSLRKETKQYEDVKTMNLNAVNSVTTCNCC